ncbi:two-component system sensor histidine kinase NtrB [Geopsychrobacter electrodiphilus]|uniref:two-component system sensor histidine kinase NtrB n=1 Tax=Geopsychrobacter electrodiphilus TaxID=225196 RepID=UPI0003612550|nr:ATP-binding protein [Geopsychrobacter electrodiphilus]
MSDRKQLFSGLGPDRLSLAWFLAFRVAVITLFLGGSAVFFLNGKMGSDIAPLLFFLLALSYTEALISALALLWIKGFRLFAQIQLFWDLLFVTAIILITGGVDSAFSFVYLLVIVSGSFLLARRQTIYVAGTAAILYGGILDLQYFGYLNFLDIKVSTEYAPYLYSVFVHVIAFLLTGFLSGTLGERWHSSAVELQRKQIDYQELERLNRTILSHISSGLMIVNRRGRIRSFNAAAEEITGYRLEEIYDSGVDDFFPGLGLIDEEGYRIISRAETVIEDRHQQRLIIGYASILIKDHTEADVGLLVTFQNLTQLKEIEAQLQRADRLAAVGRLASGMAHEIRNPLASISGSVQLLLEGSHLSAEDTQLMRIVLREADRLSRLLTDFLVFARPRAPEYEKVRVVELFRELQSILEADQRFRAVVLQIDCSLDAWLSADRNMLRQALWNLLLNAVDAMHHTGQITLAFDEVSNRLTIEDSGPGIPADIRKTIFDPFFSTKEQGTGLGLANVFSIVEAHGGRIDLGESPLGGAAFKLYFQESRI